MHPIIDLELDESVVDEEEEKKRSQKNYVPAEKPPPEMSAQIQLLLNTLDFNQIDCYRWIDISDFSCRILTTFYVFQGWLHHDFKTPGGSVH